MMWWLVILGAPAALVAYELLDEDRRAVWAKRWSRARDQRSSSKLVNPRTGGYRARQAVNPRTIRVPRSPTGVTPPRQRPAALDTSELRDLLANAKQGLDRRNGGAGLRSGGKIAISSRRAVLDTSEWRDLLAGAKLRGAEQQCYTCELLNREAAGPHEHPFEDLVAAERVERDLRHPRRSKALWELVARARALGPQPSEPVS